jgi:hypothetical protein
MRIILLKRSQYEIAKKLGVPIRPLNKKEEMQLAKQKDEKNYWLLFIICTWLLLIVSIVIWK